MKNWIMKLLTAVEPEPSSLDRRRDALADRLMQTTSTEERHAVLDEIADTDPQLYASWMTHPYEE